VSHPIQAADIGFFAAVAACGSLSAAGRELGVTTAAVSKRLLQLEARLGLPLLNRSTRRMSLTPEGELFLDKARRILLDVDELNQLLASTPGQPRGLLRINASPGFGRMHVAPAIARFAEQHPEVDVQLQLTPHPPPLSDDSFDLCVRAGEAPDARVIARYLVSNRRLLCASPAYLRQHGTPKLPHELVRHRCIVIRQGDEAFGTWRLSTGHGPRLRSEAVKVKGSLSTNDGEVAVDWALAGLGIVMRAEFDVQRYLASGRLVQVLPQYDTPGADIHAVYPQRHRLTTRVQVFVDFLVACLAK
jgi:LysR family transcriptional regulator, transcriptional activator for dmlA